MHIFSYIKNSIVFIMPIAQKAKTDQSSIEVFKFLSFHNLNLIFKFFFLFIFAARKKCIEFHAYIHGNSYIYDISNHLDNT